MQLARTNGTHSRTTKSSANVWRTTHYTRTRLYSWIFPHSCKNRHASRYVFVLNTRIGISEQPDDRKEYNLQVAVTRVCICVMVYHGQQISDHVFDRVSIDFIIFRSSYVSFYRINIMFFRKNSTFFLI